MIFKFVTISHYSSFAQLTGFPQLTGSSVPITGSFVQPSGFQTIGRPLRDMTLKVVRGCLQFLHYFQSPPGVYSSFWSVYE